MMQAIRKIEVESKMKARVILNCFVLSACLGLGIGCATVSPQEMAAADFGAYPMTYKQDVENFMQTQLRDPYSAMYRYGTPKKGVMKDGLLYGGKQHYGYIVEVGINAKNGFGGYAGEERYYFFLGEGKISDVTSLMGQMAKYLE